MRSKEVRCELPNLGPNRALFVGLLSCEQPSFPQFQPGDFCVDSSGVLPAGRGRYLLSSYFKISLVSS